SSARNVLPVTINRQRLGVPLAMKGPFLAIDRAAGGYVHTTVGIQSGCNIVAGYSISMSPLVSWHPHYRCLRFVRYPRHFILRDAKTPAETYGKTNRRIPRCRAANSSVRAVGFEPPART